MIEDEMSIGWRRGEDDFDDSREKYKPNKEFSDMDEDSDALSEDLEFGAHDAEHTVSKSNYTDEELSGDFPGENNKGSNREQGPKDLLDEALEEIYPRYLWVDKYIEKEGLKEFEAERFRKSNTLTSDELDELENSVEKFRQYEKKKKHG